MFDVRDCVIRFGSIRCKARQLVAADCCWWIELNWIDSMNESNWKKKKNKYGAR